METAVCVENTKKHVYICEINKKNQAYIFYNSCKDCGLENICDNFLVSVAFSPIDPDVFALNTIYKTISVWNVNCKKLIWSKNIENEKYDIPVDVSFSGNGLSIIATTHSRYITIYDAKNGDIQKKIQGEGRVKVPSFSLQGCHVALVDFSGYISVWDMPKEKYRYCFSLKNIVEPIHIQCCFFSLVHNMVAAGDNCGNILLWDCFTGNIDKTLRSHTDLVFCFCLSLSESVFVSASFDGNAILWDTLQKHSRMIFKGHTNWIFACSLFRDEKAVVTGSYDKTLRIWDCETGICIQKISYSNPVRTLSVSSDQEKIILGLMNGKLELLSRVPGKVLIKRKTSKTSKYQISSASTDLGNSMAAVVYFFD